MSTRHLLVPVNVEALAVGENSGDTWVNLKPDFREIYSRNKVLGSQLERPAFSPVSNLYKPGVHLHWALPDGLTHGTAEDEGGIPDFPLIPNRWLVVRIWDQGKSGKPDWTSRGWIIESDTITDDEEANIWPVPDAEKLKQPSQNPQDYCTFVGKVYALHDWQGETNPPRVEITSIGYGDPSFAACYPACRGILGFHDYDFAGIRADAEFTYMVVGWYSAPSLDPLWKALNPAADRMKKVPLKKKLNNRLASLTEFLEKTKWTYPEFQAYQEKTDAVKDSGAQITGLADIIPAAILCHGFIEGVKWSSTTKNGVPAGKTLHLAVADTATDALAALLEKEFGGDPAKLLAVFQYDLLADLEKPGGDLIVERKIHERSFRPLQRGIRWDLLQDNYFSESSFTEGGSPPIPGDIRLLLAKLNALQKEINFQQRNANSLQSEIYATWYKKVLAAEQKDELSTRLTKLQAGLTELTEKIAALENTSAAQQKKITKKLKAFLPCWKLQQFNEPEFWRPNDPVVLLAGEALQRSSRYGEDGRFRDDGRLLCRLSGTEITGIKVKVPRAHQDVTFIPVDPGKHETDESDDYWRRPFDVVAKIPVDFHQDVFALLREALLLSLDSKRAEHIITAVYKAIDPGVQHAKEIDKLSDSLCRQYLERLWDDARNPKINDFQLRRQYKYGQDDWEAEFIGQFPSPVTKNSWAGNPWLPLFLQWQVCWVTDASGTPDALGKWMSNGRDFSRKEGFPPAENKSPKYTGTSLLTPGVALHLSERLRQYNLLHENEQLRTIQTAVNSLNILGQSLGGFTDQLLMRRSHLEVRPLDPAPEDDVFGPKLADVYETVKDIDWLSPLEAGIFSPLRAGCLIIQKLWIIDAFGQFLPLEEEHPGYGIKAISSRRLRGSGGAIQLQPRLTQPARLAVHWIPSGDKASGDQENFNPVCGWILPNFLDQSLMIYDAGGCALGALQVVQKKSWSGGAGGIHEEIESFHWIDIPGSRDIFFGVSPQKMENPLPPEANSHLRNFVMGLLPLSEGCGQRFSALLNSMSEALSSLSAGGAGRNPNLALLIGKPFALVRAALRLEVDGRLVTSPDGLTGGIEKIKFPLHLGNRRKRNDLWLGDDGLAGFFLDNNYKKFYPAFRLMENSDSYNIYDNSQLHISLATPLNLTLLLDPARGFCASCGILPQTAFSFPHQDIADTLENKQALFFCGPVINPASSEEMRMPQPSDIYGQWSWTHHPEVMKWGETAIGDVERDQNVFPDSPHRIAEGWLKLVTAPLEIRAFTIQGKNPVDEKTAESDMEHSLPACFQTADKSITLSWSVTGADEIELRMEKKEKVIRLFRSQSHPLPTQYRIHISDDALFTLLARSRKEIAAIKKEPAAAAKSLRVTVLRKEK